MEMLLAVWILSAITSAAIAHNKGKNGGLWFFIGLIMGVFARRYRCLHVEGGRQEQTSSE